MLLLHLLLRRQRHCRPSPYCLSVTSGCCCLRKVIGRLLCGRLGDIKLLMSLFIGWLYLGIFFWMILLRHISRLLECHLRLINFLTGANISWPFQCVLDALPIDVDSYRTQSWLSCRFLFSVMERKREWAWALSWAWHDDDDDASAAFICIRWFLHVPWQREDIKEYPRICVRTHALFAACFRGSSLMPLWLA